MTLIEAMAKASHEFFRGVYAGLPPFEDLPLDARSVTLQHAKAILAAMEPPPAAIQTVSISSIDYTNTEVWQMFIKACLEEKAP